MKILLLFRKVIVDDAIEIWHQADLPVREFMALRMRPHIVQIRRAWMELCAAWRHMRER